MASFLFKCELDSPPNKTQENFLKRSVNFKYYSKLKFLEQTLEKQIQTCFSSNSS